MCGIAGVFNRNGLPVDQNHLIAMTHTLIHRGPDEAGCFVNAGRRGRLAKVSSHYGKLWGWEAGKRGDQQAGPHGQHARSASAADT